MYTITFYSFKGGVGRTMALVNVGAELVRRGRCVLLVDFDLEAPGLSTYEALRQEAGHPGVVEFVSEYIRTREAPDISRFLYPVDLARVQSRRKGRKSRKTRAGSNSRQPAGRLWVMPAGKGDAAYGASLASINWNALYENLDGYLFFEDTKLQWQQSVKPDYVLIDSRTGHTDVGGICTRQLADAVVLLFTPNEQNLVGLETACRDIRREETVGLKKKIRQHFVAANVPDLDDERGILRRQIQTFRERLNFRELAGVIRRCENLNLLDQSIFTLDRPHSRLARSYRRLLRTLLKENLADREGALYFLQDYPKKMESREKERGLFSFTTHEVGEDVKDALSEVDKKCLHRIARNFDSDVEMLNRVAGYFMKEEAYKSACTVLDRILQLEPNRAYALFERASCKTRLLAIDDAAEDLLACIRVLGLPHEERPSNDQPRGWVLIAPAREMYDSGLQRECIARLCHMAPAMMEKLVEVVEKGEIQGVEFPMLAGLLCRREEGVPIAARVLRDCIARGESIDSRALLRARCWKEVIHLAALGTGGGKVVDMLELALAQWGEHGEMPESLSRRALESDPEILRQWGLQAGALLFWRSGQAADAIGCLELAEREAQAETEDIFSWWWLREVSVEQYLDDCRLFRRMIQGESLRPAFLGPASMPTKV